MDRNKRDRKIRSLFELITEVMGWLRIVASPVLIGLGIGAFIYFSHPITTRLVLGIFVAAAGFVTGIIWATKVWKRKGTIWFLSRITTATPEPDHPEVKDSPVATELKKGNC